MNAVDRRDRTPGGRWDPASKPVGRGKRWIIPTSFASRRPSLCAELRLAWRVFLFEEKDERILVERILVILLLCILRTCRQRNHLNSGLLAGFCLENQFQHQGTFLCEHPSWDRQTLPRSGLMQLAWIRDDQGVQPFESRRIGLLGYFVGIATDSLSNNISQLQPGKESRFLMVMV